jgi:purine nucleosidase/pyrimidine-specific ribonucleoside hydrolase
MDAGVDDALALVLAMNSPELEVMAVTTVAGNAPVEECTWNCLLIVELLRGAVRGTAAAPGHRAARAAPPTASSPVVARGAAAPLRKPLLTAPEVHGADGLGGEIGSLPTPLAKPSRLPAHEVLTSLARKHPGELTLIATGPLTNVATALEHDRDAMALYGRVVVMGGAFFVPGNTGPVAEFNFYVDPEAADAVMRSGLDITLVPLDATTRAPLLRSALPPSLREPWPAGAEPGRDLAAILHRALDYYMRYQLGESGLDGGYMHDPLTVAAVIEPSTVTVSVGSVIIVLEGTDRGRAALRAPLEAAKAEVVFDVACEELVVLLGTRVLSIIHQP